MADLKSQFLKKQKAVAMPKEASVEADDSVSADVETILASTEKLLAVNRGLVPPDERDSLEFRRVHQPADLFQERIELDADKTMRSTMRRVAKTKSLRAVNVGQFDPYITGLIIGNPLSSPLEEINPLHLVEQARRITQMGPGGLPSEDSITPEAQNIHPSIFGFISSIEGPESSRIGVDTRMAWGTKWGSDGRIYQRMLDRKTGKYRWLSANDLVNKTVGLPR